MSDKVKLIIEIDDKDYNSILKTYLLLGDRVSSRIDNKLFRAVKNGTILNEDKVEDNQTWVVNDKGEKIAFKDVSVNKIKELLKVFAQSDDTGITFEGLSIVIPDNATNRIALKALYPDASEHFFEGYLQEWLNSPYTTEG